MLLVAELNSALIRNCIAVEDVLRTVLSVGRVNAIAVECFFRYGYKRMSGCRIKRNLNPSGSGSGSCSSGTNKEACSKEVGDALAKMIAERQKQDEVLNTVLSEKEYAEKYGTQPEANVKK